MCGIFASSILSLKADKLLKRLSKRGPDGMKLVVIDKHLLGFTHLSINGSAGMQPVSLNHTHVICNGEIYNYKQLANDYNINIPEGGSDCSILPELFQKCELLEFCRVLDGVFAMVILHRGNLIVLRDPYGVRPLFQELDVIFASEAKALPKMYGNITQFPPGSVYQNGKYTRYHDIPWIKQPYFNIRDIACQALNNNLVMAVRKRLLSDKPIGALLSGGLDSSLIVAILAKHMTYPLHTFSIGLADSPDIKHARIVSEHCNTEHHELVITERDYLEAIPKVIYDIESYDVTTVRASVGNWLIGKYISENTDIKVVFNGDGSDEIGGGYRYFKRAPSDKAFDEECVRLLQDICYFDVLRSDRCISSHGLEPRTPYLDKQFVATWLSIPTYFRKTDVEKQILREAFNGILPESVLWRKKEAFSDGMSESAPWKHIMDEADYYKEIYMQYYPDKMVPYKWMPKWSPETDDPSARTLSIY
jgi:asparagine synthase (glutamine-hydrolysing)